MLSAEQREGALTPSTKAGLERSAAAHLVIATSGGRTACGGLFVDRCVSARACGPRSRRRRRRALTGRDRCSRVDSAHATTTKLVCPRCNGRRRIGRQRGRRGRSTCARSGDERMLELCRDHPPRLLGSALDVPDPDQHIQAHKISCSNARKLIRKADDAEANSSYALGEYHQVGSWQCRFFRPFGGPQFMWNEDCKRSGGGRLIWVEAQLSAKRQG